MERGAQPGRTRWKAIGGLSLLLALAAILLWRQPASSPVKEDVVLMVSGDTNGWITPCGCASGQRGGLPRRGTLVRRRGVEAAVVYVDVGGAPSGTSEYDRLKFEAILAGEAIMGLAAHNLGGPEAALGAGYLRELAARPGSTLISANLRDAERRLIAAPARVVAAGGRRLAIISVLSPRFAAPEMVVDEPHAAVLTALKPLRGRYDALVVLAYLPESELATLAASLPEADMVLGGPTGQSMTPRQSGPTLLASATNRGKFILDAQWDRAEPPTAAPANSALTRWTVKAWDVNPDISDDPAQIENLRRFRAELERRDLAPAQTSFAPSLPADAPADYAIAGSESCRACHAADAAAWDASRHAHAWNSLEKQRAQADSFCQSCHTTGYGLPGGFQSARRSLALAGVGCEDCHGPSLAHVRNPRSKTPFLASDQCIRCHDHENSPLFAFDPFWQRIRHGKHAPAVIAPTSREHQP